MQSVPNFIPSLFPKAELRSADNAFSVLDLHFARLMERLSGSGNEALLLAAALASNAVQNGHICVDLSECSGMPMHFINAPEGVGRWPELDSWIETLAAQPVVASNDEYRPLVLRGTRLYLYRYWDYERRFISALSKRLGAGTVVPAESSSISASLAALFPQTGEEIDWQKVACAAAMLRNFCVISGGPGTGKTTTVIKIMALLEMLSGGRCRIALAAPTGKAAARLEESVAAQIASLHCPPGAIEAIPRKASTIHALLGPIPDSPYFRHNRDRLLPYDVVIVDEASMVDLALMVKLIEAIPENARIIVLGDKDQLASVEAGAVLGDICDSGKIHGYSDTFCLSIRAIVPEFSVAGKTEPPIADSIVTLRKGYRFSGDSGAGLVSRAVNAGDVETVVSLFKSGAAAPCEWWIPPSYEALIGRLRTLAIEHFGGYLRSREPSEALRLFGTFKILCAVRNGPLGVTAMNEAVEAILSSARLIETANPLYRGKPVLITRNDYSAGVYNGDIGIFMPEEGDSGAVRAFFAGSHDTIKSVFPHRLPPHETAYAMTVHKAQGSEFGSVALILPSQPSPIVTRELLYTAITRSRGRFELWCTEEALRHAVRSHVKRASGLREALWDDGAAVLPTQTSDGTAAVTN